jgi:Uncharacterised protein family UPF0047
MVRRLASVDSDVLDIDTSRRRIVDLTDAVRSFCGGHGDGLCNVFVPHATAGVAIIETGAGSDDDSPASGRYPHIDRSSVCCRVTTATATRTGRRDTARIMCCPHSWRLR